MRLGEFQGMRLRIDLDVTVVDAFAASSYLLAAVTGPDGSLALPNLPELPEQVRLIIDEMVRGCLNAEEDTAGLRIEGLSTRFIDG